MSRLELVEGYARGDITRRTFVRRLVALGVSVSAALSYSELLRPSAAQAAPGEDDFYEVTEETTLPPDVITQAPIDVAHDRATAQGLVDPNLQPTEVRFEVAQPGGPPSSTPATGIDGDGDRVVGLAIEQLQPSTDYIVRAVATNESGTSLGEFVPFRTAPAPAPVAAPAAVTAAAIPVADTLKPRVSMQVLSRSLKSFLRTGVLKLRVGADEDATLGLVLTMSVPARGRASAAAKRRTIKVAKAKATVRGGQSKTVRLKLTRAGRRALRDRDAAKLVLKVRAKDDAGNRRVRKSSLKLS